MRSHYVGDEGDFVKYTLLRRICGTAAGDGGEKLSLGIVWYLRETKRVGYLSKPGDHREADPEVFDRLQRWNRDEQRRGVRLIEGSGLLPDTVYFGCPVQPFKARASWLQLALRRVARCRVVFLDPDIGLAPGRPTRDHVLNSELEGFCCLEQRPTVVVYQHARRLERRQQIESQIESQPDHIRDRMVAVQHKRLKNRFFYVIPSTEDDGRLVLSRIAEPFEVIE